MAKQGLRQAGVMRLLWVFPSFRDGVAVRRFAALCRGLGEQGAGSGSGEGARERYEHLLVTLDGEFSAAGLIPDGTRWRRIDLPKRRPALGALGNLWAYRAVFKEAAPDLLMTAGWGARDWLVLNSGPNAAPQIFFEDEPEPWERQRLEREGAGPRSGDWWRRRLLKGRHLIIATPSRVLRNRLTREWEAPAASTHLIPDGIDLARFEAPSRIGRRGPVVLGAVGPLTARRRLDQVLKIAALLRDRGRAIRVLLVGSGPHRSELEALAARLGVAEIVNFLGAQADPAPFLAQMDVFALTSESEHTPPQLLGAMASGLPVLASRAGDVFEVVSEPNRLFVRDAGDLNQLAAAAELLVCDPDLRGALGVANRERVRVEYSQDVMVARYSALIQEALSRRERLALPAPSRLPSETL